MLLKQALCFLFFLWKFHPLGNKSLLLHWYRCLEDVLDNITTKLYHFIPLHSSSKGLLLEDLLLMFEIKVPFSKFNLFLGQCLLEKRKVGRNLKLKKEFSCQKVQQHQKSFPYLDCSKRPLHFVPLVLLQLLNIRNQEKDDLNMNLGIHQKRGKNN